MFTTSWTTIALALFSSLLSPSATPLQTHYVPSRKSNGKVVLPLARSAGSRRGGHQQRAVVGGTVGLGNINDFTYLVAVTVGSSAVSLNLDTGSSDLWIISDECKTQICQNSNAPRYNLSDAFKHTQSGVVDVRFGDSKTGTHAAGPIGRDTVTLAALTMPNQTFAAVNVTDNTAVSNGGAGILGLGFPSQSFTQLTAVNNVFGNPEHSDIFVQQMVNYGPIVSRMVLSGKLDEPMFAVTLQRNMIDPSGNGQLTIGALPEGVNGSDITWVPVRRYDPSVGGLEPPSFAKNEVYPLRWEVELDAVYLNGQILPNSTVQPNNIKQPSLSALIDTGNSLIRGPQDVVNNILNNVSPAFATNASSPPTLPCNAAHNLTFQIGGKMFPVDPRDFVSQNTPGDATTCVADNVVGTDPPGNGALFSWNLGDPFLKSNLVVFYYGNLTHPSADPPRIGFLSLVPDNATALLEQAVSRAQANGGVFSSTSEPVPTHSSAITAATSVADRVTSFDFPPFTGNAFPAPTLFDSSAAAGMRIPRLWHVGLGGWSCLFYLVFLVFL